MFSTNLFGTFSGKFVPFVCSQQSSFSMSHWCACRDCRLALHQMFLSPSHSAKPVEIRHLLGFRSSILPMFISQSTQSESVLVKKKLDLASFPQSNGEGHMACSNIFRSNDWPCWHGKGAHPFKFAKAIYIVLSYRVLYQRCICRIC
jgi:hypothetical protein